MGGTVGIRFEGTGTVRSKIRQQVKLFNATDVES